MSGLETVFLFSSVLTLASGTIIYFLNPWRAINRCYLIAAALSSLWLFFTFMAMWAGNRSLSTNDRILVWLRLSNAAAAFLPSAYFLIKEATLGSDSAGLLCRKSIPWITLSFGLATLAFTPTFFTSDTQEARSGRGVSYVVYLAGMAAMSGRVLLEAVKSLRVQQGIHRIEIKYFAINFCLATLVVVGLFLLSTALNLPALRYAGAFVVAASFGLTIWAVGYYRIFDAKQVLLEIGQRSILLASLASTMVVLAGLVGDALLTNWMVFIGVAVACLLALQLDRPLKRRLGLDRAYNARSARDAIIEMARRKSNVDDLVSSFERLLVTRYDARVAVVLAEQGNEFAGGGIVVSKAWTGFSLVCREGWVTPESISRARKSGGSADCLDFVRRHELGALLAVPRGSSTPSLIVALGRKHSLRPYTYPDIQVLLELAELMDNILTHALVAARNAEIERMEAAAIMSRGLAHDLNNLATPVAAFLLYMENRMAASSPEAAVLADAKHAVRVMQDYIRESLFFSRRLTPDLQLQSAAALLAITATSTQSRARVRGATVVVGKAPDAPFYGDRVLLLRLLQNLVCNGIDASPRGGSVTLAGFIDEMDQLVLTVTDEGPGVPPELAERIFEPYFTTKDTGDNNRGLGLGLAISLKIGALHRGTIEVARAPSGGAIFSVRLPRSLPSI